MPKIINQEERKMKILEAGLKVLNGKKFSLARVADECGITRTTIYVNYKNKKELIADVEKNLFTLENDAEKGRYAVKNFVISDEVYEKIWEVIK